MSVYSVITLTQLEQFLTQYSLGEVIHFEGIQEGAYSGPKLPPIPAECCHPFHFKAATESGEDCHPLVVTF